MVDYKSRSTPRLAFASQLVPVVGELGALTPHRSKVGILFDARCQDFQAFYTKCYKVDQNIYLNSLCGAYEAFFDAGVCADVIRLHEIDNYRLVILSNQIVIDKATAAILCKYVEAGGVIVCDGRIGIVDDFSMMNTELPGGDFNTCMGHEWIDTDYENLDFVLDGSHYVGYYGRELVGMTDGKAIAHFGDNIPAIIRKQVGFGEVITVNTYLWYGYKMEKTNADRFAKMLTDRFDLYGVRVSLPLKARVAENGNERVLFVFNYTDTEVTGHVTGYGFDCNVTVPANDVFLLRAKK